jgi:hypothetical protein
LFEDKYATRRAMETLNGDGTSPSHPPNAFDSVSRGALPSRSRTCEGLDRVYD